MKNINRLFVFMTVLSAFLVFVSCSVERGEDFERNFVYEEEKERLLEAYGFELFTEEPGKRAINCFDIRSDGAFAVGISPLLGYDSVEIYDKYGNFQYGYTFRNDGDFGIEWNGDSLAVCSVKSEFLFELNGSGTADVYKIAGNSGTHKNYIETSREKTVDGIKYTRKNDFILLNVIGNTHAKIIKEMPDGKETVIYDASADYYMWLAVIWIFHLLIRAAFAGILIALAKNIEHNTYIGLKMKR